MLNMATTGKVPKIIDLQPFYISDWGNIGGGWGINNRDVKLYDMSTYEKRLSIVFNSISYLSVSKIYSDKD